MVGLLKWHDGYDLRSLLACRRACFRLESPPVPLYTTTSCQEESSQRAQEGYQHDEFAAFHDMDRPLHQSEQKFAMKMGALGLYFGPCESACYRGALERFLWAPQMTSWRSRVNGSSTAARRSTAVVRGEARRAHGNVCDLELLEAGDPTDPQARQQRLSLSAGPDLCPAVNGLFEDVLWLGCAAIGYIVYPGSGQSLSTLEPVSELISRVHDGGMTTVFWTYPRGSGFSKPR